MLDVDHKALPNGRFNEGPPLTKLVAATVELSNQQAPFGIVTSGRLVFRAQCPQVLVECESDSKAEVPDELIRLLNLYPASRRSDLFYRKVQFRSNVNYKLLQLRFTQYVQSSEKGNISGHCFLDDDEFYEADHERWSTSQLSYSKKVRKRSRLVRNAIFLPLLHNRIQAHEIPPELEYATTGLLLVRATPEMRKAERQRSDARPCYRRIGRATFQHPWGIFNYCSLPFREITIV